MNSLEKLKKKILDSKQRIRVELSEGIEVWVQSPGPAVLMSIVQAGKIAAQKQLIGIDAFLKNQPLAKGEWQAFLEQQGKDDIEATINTLEQYGVPRNPKTQYDLEHAKLAVQIASIYTMAAYLVDEKGEMYVNDAGSREYVINNVLTVESLSTIAEAIAEINANPNQTSQNSTNTPQNGQTAKSEALSTSN